MEPVAEQVRELEQLQVHVEPPADLDAFWQGALRRCAMQPLNIRSASDAGAEIRDLTFEGLDGTPVHTWLLLPPEAREKKVPVIVRCHGANRSRGKPADFAPWLAAGCAVISPDFRLQRGPTGSVTPFDGPGAGCWWTLNLHDLMNSYLYCVWTDFLRAVRLALETPQIDAARIAADGHSQGGGMALGLAALIPAVSLCMADVPSACWMQRRIETRTGGGAGIAAYLKQYPERSQTALRNLAYFDNIHLAPRIGCPVLVSCGLADPVCPPECIYAVYNRIGSAKEMAVYPQAGHEGGGAVHLERKIAFMKKVFFQNGAV